ncbi:DHA2 family efflux MFS transporter permease subunit [Labedella phragmitis]|uniref:DHA2 family efflux MFS transporter permease subunit n=1 Tax=Labedella phragmitis TaxID=2498849 RepID=A0A3S5CFJ2_9MICO|nr:MFS transporter [Labedella phragmitis]RWZ53111.1 DHA2 family efflux MFS transporter permease subunit [Labedella phragmitis]
MSTLPVATTTSHRWWVLVSLSLTQLVVVLDGTIVNVALPQAQVSLGLTDTERQWVVTAYALAFGALLLLGGRIADYAGRKRTYLVGMIGFGLASAWGGFAGGAVDLIAARGLQGIFAALMAPAALALLTVTFPSGRDRNTAFAVFGSVAGAGAAVGLVLGGVLTEFADWRWCLWVNVPIVIVTVVAGALLLRESRAEGDNRYDIAGTLTVAAGLASLVYGFTLAENGWARLDTIGFIVAGVLLLALFVWIESRVAQPLLPLRVILHRVRGGAFLMQAVAGSVMIGGTLYLTFHLQIVLGFSPLLAGLASLPLTVAIAVVAPIATKLLPAIGPRPLMIAGPLVGAVGLLLLSRITPDGAYLTEVLPGLVVLGAGMGMLFVPLQNLALTGVAPHDAGAASATANATMQIGGSLGLSIFTTIYAAASGHATGASSPAALVDGYSAAFVAAAVGLLVAAVVAVVFIRGRKEDLLPSGEHVMVHAG